MIRFLRDFDYTITLTNGGNWTLEDAVNHLAIYQGNKQKLYDSDTLLKEYETIREQLSAAVQHDIGEGGLLVNAEYKQASNGVAIRRKTYIDFKKTSVAPIVFINWAIKNAIEIPVEYEEYALSAKEKVSDYDNWLSSLKADLKPVAPCNKKSPEASPAKLKRKSISESLKLARSNVGLTQRDFALRIGVASSTVHTWESGRSAPSRKALKKISQIYGFGCGL